MEEIVIKCLQLGGNSLLHIGVCCKSVTSQALLKRSKDIWATVTHTGNHTCVWLRCYSWFVLDHPPYRPDLMPSYNFLHHPTLHSSFRNVLTTCNALPTVWHSWIRALWYIYENNQQDALYRFIYYSKLAVHVLGDVFAQRQEHLTVFTASGSVHPSYQIL